MRDRLAHNAFQRPLHLQSSETSSRIEGDIHAQVALPFRTVGPALRDINHWCDLLILHVNVKGCQVSAPGGVATLGLDLGRKFAQPLEDAYRFAFQYRVLKSDPDYLQIELKAEDGPVGTKRYRMRLEIVGLEKGTSILHLSYAYDFGVVARTAMRGYLATGGRDKRGFSIVGHEADGTPIHVGGMRGVIERNTMRYFIAIEAYLGALSVPQAQQLDKRLNDWHAGVERYPKQLHELERGEYLAMKHQEVLRSEGLRKRAAGR